MRRGAVTTARAMAEQATAGEQISRSAAELHRLVGAVTKAMTEQASAMSEIAGAADGMRVQAEQTSRAVAEQARAMRDMTGGCPEHRQTDQADRQGQRRALVVGRRSLLVVCERDSPDHRAQRQRRQADARRHRRPAAARRSAGGLDGPIGRRARRAGITRSRSGSN